jgi:DNA-binding CsgD family transcriptional regulator
VTLVSDRIARVDPEAERQGRTNAQVAWLLRISPETVRKHLENAYETLGVHTRTGAVAALFAFEIDSA